MSANDLARTLAFAFRRKGADTMPGTDLRLLLAYDLRWFAPEDAKRVVQRGVETGLLVEAGDALQPSFDPAGIEIPVNFKPTPAVAEESAPTGLPPRRAPGAAPAPKAAPLPPPPAAPPARSAIDAAAEDERRRRGLLLNLDVARLIVQRRANEDVREAAARAEASILSAAGRPPRAGP